MDYDRCFILLILGFWDISSQTELTGLHTSLSPSPHKYSPRQYHSLRIPGTSTSIPQWHKPETWVSLLTPLFPWFLSMTSPIFFSNLPTLAPFSLPSSNITSISSLKHCRPLTVLSPLTYSLQSSQKNWSLQNGNITPLIKIFSSFLLPWDKVPNLPKRLQRSIVIWLQAGFSPVSRKFHTLSVRNMCFFLCHSPPLPWAAPAHPSTLSTLCGLPLPCVPDTPLQLLCNWPGFAQVCLLHSMNSTAEIVSGLRGPTSCDHESLNKRFWINNNIKGKIKEKALSHSI